MLNYASWNHDALLPLPAYYAKNPGRPWRTPTKLAPHRTVAYRAITMSCRQDPWQRLVRGAVLLPALTPGSMQLYRRQRLPVLKTVTSQTWPCAMLAQNGRLKQAPQRTVAYRAIWASSLGTFSARNGTQPSILQGDRVRVCWHWHQRLKASFSLVSTGFYVATSLTSFAGTG